MASKFDLFLGQFAAVGFRPADGFERRQIQLPHGGNPMDWLVPRGDIRPSSAPLANRELHRTFCQLETKQQIQSFASRWGFLGVHTPLTWEEEPSGEPLDYWCTEIRKMRDLLELWGLVQRSMRSERLAHDELERRVIWGDEDFVSLVLADGEPQSVGRQRKLTPSWEIASGFVRQAAEQRLNGSVGNPGACVCKGCITNRLTLHSRVDVMLTPEGPMLLANSLLAALYTLFVTDLYRYPSKRCMVCGEQFNSKRSDAKTCSNACRANMNRRDRKQKKALQASDGVAPEPPR